jgi:hypothetical protein
MTGKAPKRPKDANQLAKSIVDIATGSVEDHAPSAPERVKDAAAVSLGRRGGLKGGRARAVKLSSEVKSSIAKKAASARWSGKEDDN